ncbi:MAG TPA: response regulator transcription factor [Gaiellales bacterium]|nr:response regulator transcription factor [Gaiellales bacterium]
MPIRVLIADDHRIVRAGIRSFLESKQDIAVVGEAGTGEEALALARALRPDVAVMDLNMPGMGGLQSIRLIKEQVGEVHVVALTMYGDQRFFLEALAAGAEAYVLNGADPAQLLAAVRAAAAGTAYLTPEQAKRMLTEYRRAGEREVEGSGPALTAREREVLTLIAQGLTGKAIAEQLGLSPNTVERHRTNIMNKLGLHNRAELVRFAIRERLIDSDPTST